MGKKSAEGILRYSEEVGRCVLHDVTVINKGVDWARSAPFWKMGVCRTEAVEIVLQGNSVFEARGVTLLGSHTFVVKDGIRMVVREVGGKVVVTEEPVGSGGLWSYEWDDGVRLKRR